MFVNPVLDFALPPHTVEAWSVVLTAPGGVIERCLLFLDDQETARANRFRFAHHRNEFILSHGILRLLLARYTHTTPASLVFSYSDKAKPGLAFPASDIHFNLSHSGGTALYAFTRSLPLGIDLEQVRADFNVQDLAEKCFCAEEAADLSNLPETERHRAFFSCWTRKEAFIKATGDGLSLPLDSFRVSLRPGEPAALFHIGGHAGIAREWILQDALAAPGYVAALAYRGPERALQMHDLADAANAIRLLD